MEHVPNLIYIFSFGLISFVLTLIITPAFTKFLFVHKFGKQIREDTVDGKKAELFRKLHLKKEGTPTMGGVLVWGVTAVIVLISAFTPFSVLDRGQTYLPLFTLVVAGVLGALDDYFNIIGIGKKKGIGAKPKIFWLTLFGLMGAWWFYFKLGYDQIHIPALGDFSIGLWYIPLFILVIISTANAVNITDGLDGLAAGLLIIAFGGFAAIAYMKGLYVLTAFLSVLSGSLIAFLWFNVPPARFFMGDTGALSFGATLGVIAMMTNSVLILPLMGFVFVVETLSCIIQLTSKKFFNRKIFHITPLHHHFEQVGWPEYKVTMRFWIVGGLVAIVGVIIGLIGMGH
jgi:phospho-N-acetylmuramoyl-pentapeptide-transferase